MMLESKHQKETVMADFAVEYWKRVDELRGKSSLVDVAKAMDIKEQSLRNMRSENRYPKLDATKKLARFLNTSVDYLMDGKPSEENTSSENYRYVLHVMDSTPGVADSLASLIKQLKGEIS